MSRKKFIIFHDGYLLDLALYLQNVEGHEVISVILDENYKNRGMGMLETTKEFYQYLGQGYIWVFDGCERGELQDWLREEGEAVFGGTKAGDEMENRRQLNQQWFKDAGFPQVFSKNFKDIDTLIQFVENHRNTRWILKQNGDLPKAFSHAGKFKGGEDMLFHLRELKYQYNEHDYGQFDFDLMEFVEGMEVAASVFFNGKNFMKNEQGKIVGYLNWEEKKECDGGLGETTGETGTTFYGVTEDDPLFKSILLKPKIIEKLREMNFRGVFDINCIQRPNGEIVALEPTMRPGFPAASYEFIEGVENTGELLEAVAKGENKPIKLKLGWGMVIIILIRPFPVGSQLLPNESTGIGEKLWILKDGKPQKDFSEEQKKHIHLINIQKSQEKETNEKYYMVSDKEGEILNVTGRGKTIKDTRDNLLKYIKENIYLSGMKYRTDIGERIK